MRGRGLEPVTPPVQQLRVLGRYLFYAPIASGGMATVYLGRMAGPKGFSRIIAIKQLHARFVHDTDFVTMFLDEAQVIGRIHHSNVVAPIDVVEADGELCIVMEYVHGEALGRLMRLSRQEGIPLRVTAAIMVQTLLGLHAAHEVTDGDGQSLSIVHRDVSPQNILVGDDGIARVVDFGIAKVAHHARHSDPGKLKGKLGYMAPEQLSGGEIDRRCDIFAAGIILWELLTGKKLLSADNPLDALRRMSRFEPTPPSSVVTSLSPELDAVALRALSIDPNDRFRSAHDMARALSSVCPPAGAIEVAEWVTRLVGETLSTRAQWIADLISIDMSEWTQSHVMTGAVMTGPLPRVLGSTSAPELFLNSEPQGSSQDSNGLPPDAIPTTTGLPEIVAPPDRAPCLAGPRNGTPSHAIPEGVPTTTSARTMREFSAQLRPKLRKFFAHFPQWLHDSSVQLPPKLRELAARLPAHQRGRLTALLILVCIAAATIISRLGDERSPSPREFMEYAALPLASPGVPPPTPKEPVSYDTSLRSSSDLCAVASGADGRNPTAPRRATEEEPPRNGSGVADAFAPREFSRQPDAGASSHHRLVARATGSGPPSDCRVPYVVDAKRIKRFRPECFRARKP
jgi:eukaryotic-like serine/threonine-protein kinase